MATNKYIYLTSENFIRSNVNINDEVHGKYIQAAMREAQDINLQSILGTRLLKKLQELVKTNTIEDSGNTIYKECVDKCQYYLLYVVTARLMAITGVHVGNFGPSQNVDENMQSLRLSDIFEMEQYYLNKADHYCLELQNWLLENYKELPELTKKKVSQLNSNLYSSASCGLNLGGARGKGYRKYWDKFHIGYDHP